ncbi:MAG: DUF4296 domain-containing protein [Cytophagaceae bacterium]|nr:MAG: DUF4296 domain-containing protein [Cytophagaceae bacterium]
MGSGHGGGEATARGLFLGVKYARFVWRRPLRAVSGLLLALLGSCATPEEVPPPKQLLPKEKVVSLLVQLHVLEARVEASHLSPDSARALFQQQKNEILRKNDVPQKDSLLQRSYRYYAVNHKDMDEIYKAIIDSLEHREALLNGTPTKKTDHP